MPEIFKPENLYFSSRSLVAIIDVVDYLVAGIEPNQIQIVFVAHRPDVTEQVLVLLLGAIEIALFVNEPGNGLIGTKLGPELFGPETGGMDKVRPPMIMRVGFVLFPLFQRRAADEDDPFRI